MYVAIFSFKYFDYHSVIIRIVLQLYTETFTTYVRTRWRVKNGFSSVTSVLPTNCKKYFDFTLLKSAQLRTVCTKIGIEFVDFRCIKIWYIFHKWKTKKHHWWVILENPVLTRHLVRIFIRHTWFSTFHIHKKVGCVNKQLKVYPNIQYTSCG